MNRMRILIIFLLVCFIETKVDASTEELEDDYEGYAESKDSSFEGPEYNGVSESDESDDDEEEHHQVGRGFWDVVKDVGKKAVHEAKNADYKKMAKDTVQAGKDAKEFYDKA